MKKLIQGIVDFRCSNQKNYRESFSYLATGQSPDALFITCSDSRVVPDTFASTNPGDLFVLRNVGNIIPPCDQHGVSISDEAEAAAIEFSVLGLNVSDVIVCGHSECGAMQTLMNDRHKVETPNLKSWLRHSDPALEELKLGHTLNSALTDYNQLSQLNVLLQMKNVRTYPGVQKRVAEGTLTVHGWWFDLARADVYAYEEDMNRFILIDEKEAEKLLKKFK